jgi:hypothetical protein
MMSRIRGPKASKLNPEFIKLKNQIWDEVYKMYLEVNK